MKVLVTKTCASWWYPTAICACCLPSIRYGENVPRADDLYAAYLAELKKEGLL